MGKDNFVHLCFNFYDKMIIGNKYLYERKVILNVYFL